MFSKFMVLIFIALSTLIVCRRDLATHFPPNHLLGNYPLHIELFNSWKQTFGIALGVFILFIFGYKLKKNNSNLNILKTSILKNRNLSIIISSLILIITLSTIFSHYPITTLYGYISLNQGYFLDLSYFILLIYFAYFLSFKDIKYFIAGFLIILAVVTLISMSQYMGHFYLDTDWAKKIFKTAGYNFAFTTYSVSGPFGNTNYMGSYVALFLPFTFVLYFTQKDNVLRYLIGILSAGTFAMSIGCNSRAGYFACFIGLILAIILLRRQIIIQWKNSILLFLVYFLLFLGMKDRLNASAKIATEVTKLEHKYEKLYTFRTDKNMFTYSYKGAGLKIVYLNNKLYFLDLENHPITPFQDKNSSSFMKDGKPYLIVNQVEFRGTSCVLVIDPISDKRFLLTIVDGIFKVIHPTLFTFFDSVPPRAYLPYKYDHLFSYRIYIWSRTIPLLLDSPLIGHGAQTFAYYFPNDDFEGRLNVGYPLQEVFDKPHSYYFHLAFDYGILGLILYISLFVYCLFNAILFYFKNYKLEISENYSFCLAGSVAIAGYLSAAFFNDSWNGVGLYMWIFLGMIYRLTYLLKEEKS